MSESEFIKMVVENGGLTALVVIWLRNLPRDLIAWLNAWLEHNREVHKDMLAAIRAGIEGLSEAQRQHVSVERQMADHLAVLASVASQRSGKAASA